MGGLIPIDDGLPTARCKLCGKPAAGPCARCRALVCGDCCELTDTANPFAICLRCVERGGTSVTHGWLGLLGWLGAIILGLAAIAAALALR